MFVLQMNLEKMPEKLVHVHDDGEETEHGGRGCCTSSG